MSYCFPTALRISETLCAGAVLTIDPCRAGRWEARIGIPGSRHIYLGLYNEEREVRRHLRAQRCPKPRLSWNMPLSRLTLLVHGVRVHIIHKLPFA